MKNIDTAVAASKNNVTNDNNMRILREKALVIESIKREFGITNFSNESADVRKSIRSLILEMWDPNTGLTKVGLKFVNEGGNAPLTKDSTDGQIKSHIRRALMTSCVEYANTNLSSGALREKYESVCKDVMKSTGVKKEFINECYTEMVRKAVNKAVGTKL